MRLYHSPFLRILALIILLAGCTTEAVPQALVNIRITADGKTLEQTVLAGSTVQQALEQAELNLGPLDRVDPPTYSPLVEDTHIQVVRVKEEFEIEQEVIPFEQLRQPTELLPEGEVRLDPLQRGETGLQEVTYRTVLEDGVEVSRTRIKTVVIREAQPQIMLVGVKSLFTPTSIPGRLVYLVGGNAWMMEETTANRRPLIAAGDLDGRVLSLSPDGSWLLFTRSSQVEGQINTLWAANIDAETIEPVDLQVENVIHFADWVPGESRRVAYSTVEPRPAAPGWQANNDLNYLFLYESGAGTFQAVELNESIGGSYGWWGTDFAWAPDGQRLAFSDSSGVGLLGSSREEETPVRLLQFSPLQTRSDWAWIPGVSWSPDGQILYTVEHVPSPELASPDESQLFDLTAVPVQGGPSLRLVSNVGMFAYPQVSPARTLASGETSFQVAYLQAIFPLQSESSRYELWVMDRDGSNRRKLFPPEGEPGLEPQQLAWSPAPVSAEGGFAIAFIYQGNLWLVDVDSGEAHQVTGDEMVSRVIWKGN